MYRYYTLIFAEIFLYSARCQSLLSFQVIAAEGEMNASRALKEAAEIISESPSALQLRYLQTLTTISAEKNSTIIFPLPVNFLSRLLPSENK